MMLFCMDRLLVLGCLLVDGCVWLLEYFIVRDVKVSVRKEEMQHSLAIH